MKFWDAWYFKSLIAGQADFYFTDLLFYPDGLSLVYHNFNVPHMVVFGGLQAVMPTSNAFNLTYLLIIFSTALSAYVYLCYLLKDKWISLFGAVVLGLSGYVVGRASQPDVSWIATLPLALYFFPPRPRRKAMAVYRHIGHSGWTDSIYRDVHLCLPFAYTRSVYSALRSISVANPPFLDEDCPAVLCHRSH